MFIWSFLFCFVLIFFFYKSPTTNSHGELKFENSAIRDCLILEWHRSQRDSTAGRVFGLHATDPSLITGILFGLQGIARSDSSARARSKPQALLGVAKIKYK